MSVAVKKTCLDCGGTYYKRPAHLEECPGPVGRRCEARVPGWGHGIWTYCVRPWSHEGEHIYR